MCIQTMKSSVVGTNTYLGIVADSSEQLTLKVLDVYGKIAKTIQTQIEDGMKELVVNISDLKMGSYVVNAFSRGKFLKATRFIKND